MYCTHCGTLNEDRARYCKKCGTPLESPPKEEKTYSPDNRIRENTAAESPGRKWLLLAAGILGILLLIVPVYLFLSGRLGSLLSGEKNRREKISKAITAENMETGSETADSLSEEDLKEETDPALLYDSQLQQGNLCIEEFDYTGAVNVFQEAAAAVPNRAEAYLGAADAYIRLTDYDSALAVLQEGLEKTGGDQHLADRLARVETGNITDSSGNVRQRTRYDSSGTLLWYQEFTYDAEERLVLAVSYDADGNQTGSVEIFYDENGNPVTGCNYSSDTGEVLLSEKTYDENGILTQVRNYRAGTYFTMIYEYDSQGRLTYIEEYDAENRLGQLMFYEYEGDSRHASFMKGCQPDGSLIYFAEYEYNTDGNRTQITSYDADGTIKYITKYLYDSNGENISQERYDSSGNLTETTAL